MEKTYKVVWQEEMSAMVQANSAEEARELALKGEVDADNSKLIGDVEAIEMEDK